MKRQDFLILIFSSFFVVIAWISFNVYHHFVKSTIPEKLNVEIIPISADFDTETINKLKLRKKVEPLYEFKEQVSITPTPVLETESATNSSSVASEGGVLSE